MKVRDLIKELKAADPNAEVICQKDAEGNGYSPLSGIDLGCVYLPDSTWSGEVLHTGWSADDACMEDDQWEEIKRLPRCVVLHPTN